MRYYSYYEYVNDDSAIIITKSEEEIRKEYWSWWYGQMIQRFGREVTDSRYNFDDCLDDWIVVNHAWEVK
jgi:hypothetical protein